MGADGRGEGSDKEEEDLMASEDKSEGDESEGDDSEGDESGGDADSPPPEGVFGAQVRGGGGSARAHAAGAKKMSTIARKSLFMQLEQSLHSSAAADHRQAVPSVAHAVALSSASEDDSDEVRACASQFVRVCITVYVFHRLSPCRSSTGS